jgi:hypothetical protein
MRSVSSPYFWLTSNLFRVRFWWNMNSLLQTQIRGLRCGTHSLLPKWNTLFVIGTSQVRAIYIGFGIYCQLWCLTTRYLVAPPLRSSNHSELAPVYTSSELKLIPSTQSTPWSCLRKTIVAPFMGLFICYAPNNSWDIRSNYRRQRDCWHKQIIWQGNYHSDSVTENILPIFDWWTIQVVSACSLTRRPTKSFALLYSYSLWYSVLYKVLSFQNFSFYVIFMLKRVIFTVRTEFPLQ